MRIVRLMDKPDWKSLLPRVEDIFFTSSRVQEFPDEGRRAQFKARWLGRYLDHYLESFFVAHARDPKKWEPVFGKDHAQNEKFTGDAVVGYLAGCLENPALNPLFADLGYYRAFGQYCASYPCHLHINVDAALRNLGVGAALIEAFAAQASGIQAPGMHIVTNDGARNIRFYERNGFRLLATTHWNDASVVFMGRQLVAALNNPPREADKLRLSLMHKLTRFMDWRECPMRVCHCHRSCKSANLECLNVQARTRLLEREEVALAHFQRALARRSAQLIGSAGNGLAGNGLAGNGLAK